jgi:hypothetical protein
MATENLKRAERCGKVTNCNPVIYALTEMNAQPAVPGGRNIYARNVHCLCRHFETKAPHLRGFLDFRWLYEGRRWLH